MTVAIQVNGKLRAALELARDIDRVEAERMALADPAIVKAMAGKPAKA